MRRRSALLLLSSAVLVGANAPRGVSPEDAKLYTPSAEGTFTCIAHPSITIPFERVNDDFCDCPDGSDEPGTAACAVLPPKNLSIRGFWCRNTHHTPAYLPLSRVNDGICDYEICCDGSDEYLAVGGVKCPNRCKEIGTAARKLAAERNRVRSLGVEARNELVRKAGVLKKEIQDNIQSTKAIIEGMEIKVQKLEEELRETEIRERNKVVRNPKPGSKVSIVVQLAKEKIEEYRTTLERLRTERDDAERKLAETEKILKTFREEYNPNFNDEGVKRAVRAWEEYLAANQATERNRALESDLEELVKGEETNWEEIAGGDEEVADDVAALYAFEEYLPTGFRSFVREKLADLRQFLVDNGVLAHSKDGVPESDAVKSARGALDSAKKDLDKHRSSLKSHEEDLNKSYGPDDVFRSLKGECISRDLGEYKYEYCFLDKAYQHSLKDHSKTSLGNFARITNKDETSHNDAAGVFESGWEEAHDEPLSGVVLEHDNGQQCWNGPRRSVNVELYCCAENEIRSVVEMEKCVYKFEVGTPAVCGSGNGGADQEQRIRDEL